MIDLLKIVNGAVATKDVVPVLNNFCLYRSLFNNKGRIQGGNGVVCIDAPFEHPIKECTVNASRFIKAIEACGEMPDFDITPTGRLSIKKGKFKAYLATLPITDYPIISQEGTLVKVKPTFVDAIASIKQFVSEDASRVWSMSVLISGGYLYATNNVIVVRVPYELDYEYDVSLPIDAVNRIIDIQELPSACYVSELSFTLEYRDMWMRSQLTNAPWPGVSQLFDGFSVDVVVPPDLKSAVEKVKSFCVNEKFPVIKLGEEVATDSADEGASMSGFELPKASFHADQLTKVLSVATHIDFSTYPKPCFFKGKGIEGMIIGIRTEN